MSASADPAGGGDTLAIDVDVVAELLCGFIRQGTAKSGHDTVVIGLSGGVDSALSAALGAEALGARHVIPVLMPYRTSNPASERDARAVCAAFGLVPTVVDISPQIDAYFERAGDVDRLRRGNKMARERMTVLYDLSEAHHALVLGTSNKTELLLGYGTIFGDMASALNPIGDLYKTQVWVLARALGVPREVVEKAPSADLWEGQSDEADLGFSYREVDRLLYSMVDERRSADELRHLGFGDELVREVGRRVRLNQFKRRLPVIAKLGARTIDRDFRYPRDWGL